jgi:hypothetical protein
MPSLLRRLSMPLAFACAAALAGQPVAFAQVTPADPPAAGAPAPVLSAAELEKLVGPIALYPDDLVAIILPASTYPLQIVQAQRFLAKRKANSQLQPEAAWDDSVKSLLNYPDIVKKMNDDLDWSQALGEAVVADNTSVLDAVQAFRRKAHSAGNLKSDDKQVVVVEKEIIKVVPADPQVIYVPQYQPSTVVVAGAPYAYYPTPYPVYYYPYAPGAAFATGLIWGAAIGAAWNGGHYNTNWGGGNNNITINRGGNTINTGDRNRPGGGTRPGGSTGSTAWKPSQQPGQVGRPSAGASSRVGDAQRGAGGGPAGGAARPSTQPAAGGRPSGGQGDAARGGGQAGARPSAGSAGRADGGAFGGMSSGSAAQRSSARGQSSRSASSSFGGGGARAGGGRSGGGGRRR